MGVGVDTTMERLWSSVYKLSVVLAVGAWPFDPIPSNLSTLDPKPPNIPKASTTPPTSPDTLRQPRTSSESPAESSEDDVEAGCIGITLHPIERWTDR